MCSAAGFAQTVPLEELVHALERVATAAESGSFHLFSEALDSVPKGAAAGPVVQAYEDLRAVWNYSLTNPIGSFYDDQSSNGLFTRLAARYPEYRDFVRPLAVRASDGRTLYPTAETRRFLRQVAAARLSQLRATSQPTQLPPPVTQPVPPPPSPQIAPRREAPLPSASPITSTPGVVKPAVAATETTVATAGTCDSPVEIRSIELSSRGLVIRANGPLFGRIVQVDTVRQEGFAGFSTLTVEVPGAVLGYRSRGEWESGPFVSMRIVRYRTGAECGLRIRLQPRAVANWRIEPIESGILITQEIVPGTRRAEEAAAEAAGAGRSGSLRTGGSYARSKVERSAGVSTSQLQAAFAQEIPSLGTLRGFIADTFPHATRGYPYRGLALTGVVIGPTRSDFVAGDLTVNFGETGIAGAGSIHALLMRGGGTSWLLPGRVGFQVFGGRTAESALVRIPGQTDVTSPLSEDRVYGVQVNWGRARQDFGVGVGWTRSVPRATPPRNSFVESFEARRGLKRALRIVLEESRSATDRNDRRWGFASTIEPRFSGEKINISGYARWLTKHFTPPLASSLFAGLRRSYGLFGSYAPVERLTMSASFGQSKTFSIFDPEQVGTLSEFRGGAIGYRFSSSVAASVDYSTSDLKSEPGSILPASSDTNSLGLTTSVRRGSWNTSIRASRDETINRIEPSLGVESRRLDIELSRPFRESGELFGRGKYAASRRPDGTSAGADYAGSLGLRSPLGDRSSIRGELGVGVTPAGVAASEVRRAFASFGYQNTSSRSSRVGAQFTYEVLRVGAEPTRHAFFVMTNFGGLAEWGSQPRPTAPFSDRALQLVQSTINEITFARLHVIVFVDENRNGHPDPGERRLAKVQVRIDGRAMQTSSSGEVEVQLTAGRHRVALEPRGEAVEYFAPDASRTIFVTQLKQRELWFGLQPGGRIVGRILFKGEKPLLMAVAGVRLTAKGAGLDRETVSDEQGEFRFGVLPTGEYTVAVDSSTLDQETILDGPAEAHVRLLRNGRPALTFTIRKATARERILRHP